MNRWLAMIVCGMVLIGLMVPAMAFGGSGKMFCWRISVPDCVGAYGCDDYQRKCAPCVRRAKCFTCDDYCPRCAPCVRPVNRFTCDDYCRKPFSFCCPGVGRPKCLEGCCDRR
jgi:hypothetical protein